MFEGANEVRYDARPLQLRTLHETVLLWTRPAAWILGPSFKCGQTLWDGSHGWPTTRYDERASSASNGLAPSLETRAFARWRNREQAVSSLEFNLILCQTTTLFALNLHLHMICRSSQRTSPRSRTAWLPAGASCCITALESLLVLVACDARWLPLPRVSGNILVCAGTP